MCLYFAGLLNTYTFCFTAEGKRFSLPNSRIMIHQPLGGAQGGQTDIDIQVRFFVSFYFELKPLQYGPLLVSKG